MRGALETPPRSAGSEVHDCTRKVLASRLRANGWIHQAERVRSATRGAVLRDAASGAWRGNEEKREKPSKS